MLIRSHLEVRIAKVFCEVSAGYRMHVFVCGNADISFLELFVAFLMSWVKRWTETQDFTRDFIRAGMMLKDRLETSTTNQSLEYMLYYWSCPKTKQILSSLILLFTSEVVTVICNSKVRSFFLPESDIV